MAFDGIMMTLVKKEMLAALSGARVSQIYQPARDELVFAFRPADRTPDKKTKKVLIKLSDSPRVHISCCDIENPPSPPMMCMLLRKRLGGAKLLSIDQPENERILIFRFEAINEIGDREDLSLAVEIMGRYSNAILIDGDENIIESVRRIDFSMSEDRVLLPKMKYELPKPQEKLSVEVFSTGEIVGRILSFGEDERAVLAAVQGISPVISREISFRASKNAAGYEAGLAHEIDLLKKLLSGEEKARPTLVFKADGAPMDISFLDVFQYEGALKTAYYESFSSLLDGFFSARDLQARMKAKSQDISKLLNNSLERLCKKINLQKADLKKCADREQLRIKGDLLQANLYRIKKGSVAVTLENFYDENNAAITIRLNPAESPAKNAQKFYKEYNKAKTREQMLTLQIKKAEEELAYLESVRDTLSRAKSEAELSAIRAELQEEGYLKTRQGQKRKEKPLPPLEFFSSDGFRILVGRNNKQNDILTLKTASKTDIWLHTKNIPGSHTIIQREGKTISDTAVREAAALAAAHSKAKASAQVPVDYTEVKNVSKPAGAKPGKVIYVSYKTIYVTPKETETI